jgi:hypothetical protein
MNLTKGSIIKQILAEINSWKEFGLRPQDLLSSEEGQLKREYRELARCLHPDKVGQDLTSLANEVLKIIEHALAYQEYAYAVRDRRYEATLEEENLFKKRYGLPPLRGQPQFAVTLFFIASLKSIPETLDDETQNSFITAMTGPYEDAGVFKSMALALQDKNYEVFNFILKTPAGKNIVEQAKSSRFVRNALLELKLDKEALDILITRDMGIATILAYISSDSRLFTKIFPLLSIEHQNELLATMSEESLSSLTLHNRVVSFLEQLSLAQRIDCLKRLNPQRKSALFNNYFPQVLKLFELREEDFKAFHFKDSSTTHALIDAVQSVLAAPIANEDKYNYLVALKKLAKAVKSDDKKQCIQMLNELVDSTERKIIEVNEAQRFFLVNILIRFIRWLGLAKPEVVTQKSKDFIKKVTVDTATVDTTAVDATAVDATAVDATAADTTTAVIESDLARLLFPEGASITTVKALTEQNYLAFWASLSNDQSASLLKSSAKMTKWFEKVPESDYNKIFEGLSQDRLADLAKTGSSILEILNALPVTTYEAFLTLIKNNLTPESIALIFDGLPEAKKEAFLRSISPGLTTETMVTVLKHLKDSTRDSYLTMLDKVKTKFKIELFNQSSLVAEVLKVIQNPKDFIRNNKDRFNSSAGCLFELFNLYPTSGYADLVRILDKKTFENQTNVGKIAYLFKKLPLEKRDIFIRTIGVDFDLDHILKLLDKLDELANKQACFELFNALKPDILTIMLVKQKIPQISRLLGYKHFIETIGKDKFFANQDAFLALFKAVDIAEYPALVGILDKNEFLHARNRSQLVFVLNNLELEQRRALIKTIQADLSLEHSLALLLLIEEDKRLPFLLDLREEQSNFLKALSTNEGVLAGVLKALKKEGKIQLIDLMKPLITDLTSLVNLVKALDQESAAHVLDTFPSAKEALRGSDNILSFLSQLPDPKKGIMIELLVPKLMTFLPDSDAFLRPFCHIIDPSEHGKLLRYLQGLSEGERELVKTCRNSLLPLYREKNINLEEIIRTKPEELLTLAQGRYAMRFDRKMGELITAADLLVAKIKTLFLDPANEHCEKPILAGVSVVRKWTLFVPPIVPKYKDAFVACRAEIQRQLAIITGLQDEVERERSRCTLGYGREAMAVLKEKLGDVTADFIRYVEGHHDALARVPAMTTGDGSSITCLDFIAQLQKGLKPYRSDTAPTASAGAGGK